MQGSLILGQVSQINELDLAISLPNNLTGYVPITSISDKLTRRIEAAAAAEDSDNEDAGLANDIDLATLFSIGQYLRVYVASTGDESENPAAGKQKKRIELSLKPQHTNSTLSEQNVVVNNTVMASVTSVEDHGIIVDIDIANSDMKGFISSKEVGQNVPLSDIQEGAVLLCIVTGLASNGRTVKLSSDTTKLGNVKKGAFLASAPTVEAFVPGTAVEVLITEVESRGIIGKVMGMVDVTADLTHSGAGGFGKELDSKYKIGAKTKARVISTFPNVSPMKLAVSLLDHVTSLTSQTTSRDSKKKNPLDVLPLSAVVETAIVRKVEDSYGLYVDVGVKGVPGFVHISRVKDGKIETLSASSGPFKVDSVHKGRIIGYNSLDGHYLLSFESTILDQPFLRVEDLVVGGVVKGTVERIIINAKGAVGILVNLSTGISGMVPEAHMADVQLLHPEKKFKEGLKVTARVLSVDTSKRQVRLTLKKTLVNSDSTQFMAYEDIQAGMQSPGTIINLIPSGAVVQFYGDVRAFLPVGEMSEAYIQDPKQHFKIGQVVNVHVLQVNAEDKKMTVSCKDPSAFGLEKQAAFKDLHIGEVVSGVVTAKSDDDITVEISGSSLAAVLPMGQLTDSTVNKNTSALKRIRVGQTMKDLVVLEKMEKQKLVTLTNKPSLLKDAKNGRLLTSIDNVKLGEVVHGFVKNVTQTAVFVQFGGGLTALLPKKRLSAETQLIPEFGMVKHQSLELKIVSVDKANNRFLLGMNVAEKQPAQEKEVVHTPLEDQPLVNAVDSSVQSTEEYTMGKLTKARIVSIKDTQINVQLADNVQGRIDVSQVFDSWDDIKDRKKPLKSFSPKQILDVKILGVHDARNHRFLPISHRSGKNSVFELSAKPSDQKDDSSKPLTLGDVTVGSSWIAYVNNVASDCLWVNLSPNVRGRIRVLDVSEDVSMLKDLDSNFPVGSALKVHVTHVDASNNRLDLSARSAKTSEVLTFKSLSKGMIVPAKVTKVTERSIIVQLSPEISAPIHLTDLTDDYSQADPTKYSKNDVVRVCIVDIDAPNKKIRLSSRPSRVLSSSLKAEDPEITSTKQLKVNNLIRGFVKTVTDKGVFINLGGNVTAYVRVSELSDSFLKDWKSAFEVDQLVKGKLTSVDVGQVQMSLKASVIDKDYIAPLTFKDLSVGQVVTGKIRKVEDFGVFIVVDNSKNVSGLCHVSEMAQKRVHDVKKLYEEGDAVKAIVLKKDEEKQRISFGLKASYFGDAEEEEESEDEDGEGVELEVESEDNDDDEDGGIDLDNVKENDSDVEDADASDVDMEDAPQTELPGLSAGGFDWSGTGFDENMSGDVSDNDAAEEKPKKKRKKTEIQIDKTGDLDANGPQSISDFERLLLGQPDSSALWIQYMAFQMQLSELGKARDIAERAIKTINSREETEKLNIWIAYLNLENAYGTDETTEEVFKRACQYNDAQEVYERLTSIYIQSGKHQVSPDCRQLALVLTMIQKADELFQVFTKKFSQSPDVWYNYAHFLHTTLAAPDRARALLPRATQSLPPHAHLALTIKFGALEFHSPSGSAERGRTIFEGTLSTFPKRLDIWNQLLDLELQQGDKDIIRGVFERATKVKGLKPKGAKSWFKKWSEWEEQNGDKKSQEKVKARAEEWVRAASASKGKDDE